MTKKSNEFDQGKINFIGLAPMFTVVSALLVVISMGLVFFKGLNYGIDFAGGTEIQVKFSTKIEAEKVRTFVNGLQLKGAQVQAFDGGGEYMIRFETEKGVSDKETNEKQTAQINKVTEGLKSTFGGAEIRRVDSVGPQVGSQLKKDSMLALFYSLLLILIYVGLRFDYEFAPGAVLCLFHDAVITLGFWSILGKEVNVQILAAVLTLIGYSLNDTIINYDRVRENIQHFKGIDLKLIINRSINEMLGRTLITTMTVMVACLSLYLFAGGVISDFALAMMIGLFFGTYSSIYVAAPLTVVFNKLRK